MNKIIVRDVYSGGTFTKVIQIFKYVGEGLDLKPKIAKIEWVEIKELDIIPDDCMIKYDPSIVDLEMQGKTLEDNHRLESENKILQARLDDMRKMLNILNK